MWYQLWVVCLKVEVSCKVIGLYGAGNVSVYFSIGVIIVVCYLVLQLNCVQVVVVYNGEFVNVKLKVIVFGGKKCRVIVNDLCI